MSNTNQDLDEILHTAMQSVDYRNYASKFEEAKKAIGANYISKKEVLEVVGQVEVHTHSTERERDLKAERNKLRYQIKKGLGL